MSIMGFLAIVNAYTMRVSLSVAIVQMVGSSNSSDIDPNACPIPPNDGGPIVEVLFKKVFLPQNIEHLNAHRANLTGTVRLSASFLALSSGVT